MQKMITLLLVAAFALAGCESLGRTTVIYPDGTTEVREANPAIIQGLVTIGVAALEARGAANPGGGGIDQPPRDLLEDLAALQEIARATQLIAQDGVTTEELAELQELYRQAAVLLERNGVRLKLKVNK